MKAEEPLLLQHGANGAEAATANRSINIPDPDPTLGGPQLEQQYVARLESEQGVALLGQAVATPEQAHSERRLEATSVGSANASRRDAPGVDTA